MKPLEQTSIDKSLFGIVPDLRQLFEDFRYCKDQRGPEGNVITPRPAGYFFMGSEEPRIKTWLKTGNRPMAGNLSVKPSQQVVERVNSRCTGPRIGSRLGDLNWNIPYYFQAFKIIPWTVYDHALIVATDLNMIAHPWVAFVPLDAIPDINPDNTPTWAGEEL